MNDPVLVNTSSCTPPAAVQTHSQVYPPRGPTTPLLKTEQLLFSPNLLVVLVSSTLLSNHIPSKNFHHLVACMHRIYPTYKLICWFYLQILWLSESLVSSCFCLDSRFSHSSYCNFLTGAVGFDLASFQPILQPKFWSYLNGEFNNAISLYTIIW